MVPKSNAVHTAQQVEQSKAYVDSLVGVSEGGGSVSPAASLCLKPGLKNSAWLWFTSHPTMPTLRATQAQQGQGNEDEDGRSYSCLPRLLASVGASRLRGVQHYPGPSPSHYIPYGLFCLAPVALYTTPPHIPFPTSPSTQQMKHPRSWACWLSVLVAAAAFVVAHAAAAPTEAVTELVNDASVGLDVYWRDEGEGGDYTLIVTVARGARSTLKTFQGHGFLVTEQGTAVSPSDRPNFTQQLEKQALRVRGNSRKNLAFEDLDLTKVMTGTKDNKKQRNATGSTSSSSSSEEDSAASAAPSGSSQVLVKNNAGETVFVYWLNPTDGTYVLLGTLVDGTELNFNSFIGHDLHVSAFSAAEAAQDDQAPNMPVRRASYTLRVLPAQDDEEDVVLQIEKVPEKETKKKKKSAAKASTPRKTQQKKPSPPPLTKPAAPYLQNVTIAQAKQAIHTCQGEATCIVDALYRGKVAKIQQRIQNAMTKRDDLEEKYRDYACLNHVTIGPEEMRVSYWNYTDEGVEAATEATAACANDKSGTCTASSSSSSSSSTGTQKQIRVDHYFDTDKGNAKIYLLHDVVTETECDELRNRASGRLASAAITGDIPGERILSSVRKAKVAMVKPNLSSDASDVLAPLQRRLFAFVNEHGGGGYENFGLAGQEPFNVIMYNVSGDEYRAHCDGYCDSSKFVPGGRAATVVLYCEEAARGGQTSFTAADILLKGKAGQAAFFHYRGEDGYMDSGYTKHSGCPLVEGNKWIATQWIRRDVSAATPWYWFSPTGDKDAASSNVYSQDPHH